MQQLVWRAGRPWVELGLPVNAGVAYVGNVGEAVVGFTAARMQQGAAARAEFAGHAQPIDASVLRPADELRQDS